MTTPLTALERDLLACVERLVTACEVSAKELSGLEARSTTQDAEPDGWIGRLRVGAHSIANGVRGCVARLVERGLELREAAHATRDQLEISESRRREVETELEDAGGRDGPGDDALMRQDRLTNGNVYVTNSPNE